MSRKRISSCQRAQLHFDPDFARSENSLECSSSIDDYDDEECVYYRPGCYCIPQVLHPNAATPYTCAHMQNGLAMRWPTTGNVATYVVDACGSVYYFSDFEYMLQLPSLTVETEITYHYDSPTDGTCDSDEADGETVSPRKKERFDDGSDNNDDDDNNTKEIEDENANKSTSNRSYRAKEGYIVEEPSEEETVTTASK